jgi:hypothetical protein
VLSNPGILLVQAAITALGAVVLSVPLMVRRAETIRDKGIPATAWHRWLVRSSEAAKDRFLSDER